MSNYELYYIGKDSRIECMLVCSLKRRIDWAEDGLKLASWKYDRVAAGKADSINDVFKRHSTLNIDRRRKKQRRSANIGDVIVFDGVPWIVCAFGFTRVPDILWSKIS